MQYAGTTPFPRIGNVDVMTRANSVLPFADFTAEPLNSALSNVDASSLDAVGAVTNGMVILSAQVRSTTYSHRLMIDVAQGWGSQNGLVWVESGASATYGSLATNLHNIWFPASTRFSGSGGLSPTVSGCIDYLDISLADARTYFNPNIIEAPANDGGWTTQTLPLTPAQNTTGFDCWWYCYTRSPWSGSTDDKLEIRDSDGTTVLATLKTDPTNVATGTPTFNMPGHLHIPADNGLYAVNSTGGYLVGRKK